jgi:hypothetical protein
MHEVPRHFEPEAEKPTYNRPPDDVVAAIRKHLADFHGLKLNLRRDVTWPGNRARNTIIDLELPNYMRRARFWCDHCGPGRNFGVGEPIWGPERVSYLRRTQPELESLLRGLPEHRWVETLKLWERGELQPRILDAALARERQKTRPPRDPASARRKAGCQKWMLDRYAELGTREAVWDELEEIIAGDRERWYEISGAYRAVERGTLEAYWKAIPSEERGAAKRRFLERPEAERKAELAAHRRHKLTP